MPASGPLTAFPAMIGEIATTRSRRATSASRTPSTARIGSSETNGFDGASTITSAVADGVEHAGRRSGGKPVEAHGAHRIDGPTADEPLLELELAGVRPDARAQPVVGRREQPDRESEPPGEIGGDRRQRLAGAQALGAHEVEADVAVAEDEPVGSSELARRPPARRGCRRPRPTR